MKTNTKQLSYLIIGVITGCLITFIFYSLSGTAPQATQNQASVEGEREPLYWVAPMDPSYKRDKPGKSPMGMDLVPVYANAAGSDMETGTIRISADVVNNLGVRTAVATRRVMQQEIQTVGYVKYDEDHLVHIHPRVEGWIEKLYVKAAGDPVTRGQPLYELYSPSLVNAQEELVLALDRNNTRLSHAAENRLNALQFSKSAVEQLKETKQIKQSITFFAPQTGVIDNLEIREGFYVKPGTTMMSIGILDEVWVEAEVFERQASSVAIGLPVTMSLDYLPGKEWQGKVDYVYPSLDPTTRTVKIRLRFDNKNKVLKPNMFAQIIIHAENSPEALLVPREAVIRTGNVNRVVLALGEGRFKSVAVNVGRFDDQYAEILDGLKENELVVVSAQFLLDSESSKTSDFKRMHHQHDETAIQGASAQAESPQGVWTRATINNTMIEHRMVSLSHPPINEWGWPAMTMDFDVAESVDISTLKPGMKLQVEIRETKNGRFEIFNVEAAADRLEESAAEQQAPKMDSAIPAEVDHQNMDHGSMDHGQPNK